MEDPGIPLVAKSNGKFSRYVQMDGTSTTHSSTDIAISAFGIKSRYDNIGYKLRRRKQLIVRRRNIVNFELAMALTGIALMLLENELFIQGVVKKSDVGSLIIKIAISVTTVFLLVAIVLYHFTDVHIHMVDNSWEDWRLAMNFPKTYLKIIIELLVCSIHPFPGNIEIPSYGFDGKFSMVPLDAILSILMLSRLYIVGMFTVIHHHLLANTSTQCVGSLNKVNIDTSFVFRALMSTMPGTMIIVIMFMVLIIDSWSLRTCEVYFNPDSPENNYQNSTWLIAITFLTIGYGDLTPTTYCGRFVAILSGFMGVGSTALLVAVLAQKLEQTRPEKYVYNFMSRVQLDKIRKNAASDIIKYAILLWRLRNKGPDGSRRTHLYGKMLQAIHTMREAKNAIISMGESSVGIIEVAKNVNDVFGLVEKVQDKQSNLHTKMDDLEVKIANIDKKLDKLLSN